MTQSAHKIVTVALTGASGAPYGFRLVQHLLASGCTVYLLISKAAQLVIATETDVKLPAKVQAMQEYFQEQFAIRENQVSVFGREHWMAPVASGSSRVDAMVVCPCSTGSLAAIATGACNNLIERAADVTLKERRQLILVPREAPYSAIHLEHMLSLTRQGAIILPASPGFYHKPQSIDDLVDFIVARILNLLDIPQTLLPPWGQV